MGPKEEECPSDLVETRLCNEQECPVGCAEGVWTEWNTCGLMYHSCIQSKIRQFLPEHLEDWKGESLCSPPKIYRSCNPAACEGMVPQDGGGKKRRGRRTRGGKKEAKLAKCKKLDKWACVARDDCEMFNKKDKEVCDKKRD